MTDPRVKRFQKIVYVGARITALIKQLFAWLCLIGVGGFYIYLAFTATMTYYSGGFDSIVNWRLKDWEHSIPNVGKISVVFVFYVIAAATVEITGSVYKSVSK